MRHLRYVLQEVSRLGKAGTSMPQAGTSMPQAGTSMPQAGTSSVQVPARHLGSSGLSLSSTDDRRRRPTGAMELRRAVEVQKCADKVRCCAVDDGTENAESGMVMTMAMSAPQRLLAVSGLVPPSLARYSPRSGWKSALICLGNMRKGGVAPGSAAYNVALRACVGAGEWDRAAALLVDMEGSGATADVDVLREIKAAGGAGAGAGAARLQDDGLTCDSSISSSDVSVAAAAAAFGSRSGSSGSRRSMSSLGSRNRGGGGGGSAAGMHTVAVDADIDWPSRRPAHDCCDGGSRGGGGGGGGGNEDSESLMSFDPFSVGPITSNASSINSSGSGSSGSIAGMHTVADGADGAWPSRRPTSDGSSSRSGGGGGGDGGDGGRSSARRSLGNVSWGHESQERWHKHEHLLQHENDTTGPHSGAARLGSGAPVLGKAGAGWLSAKAAPFAGSWGDD